MFKEILVPVILVVIMQVTIVVTMAVLFFMYVILASLAIMGPN